MLPWAIVVIIVLISVLGGFMVGFVLGDYTRFTKKGREDDV